jgi:hypothetical protein
MYNFFVDVALVDNRPPAVKENIYRFPHSDPADNKETFRKESVQEAFFKSRKQPYHKQAEKKEGKGYYKVSSALVKQPFKFYIGQELFVRKVVLYSFFQVSFDFCTDLGRRKVYHDFKGLSKREFIYSVIKVFFCIRIKLFFVKRGRVKRIKELQQAFEFEFDHRFSFVLSVKSFRTLTCNTSLYACPGAYFDALPPISILRSMYFLEKNMHFLEKNMHFLEKIASF